MTRRLLAFLCLALVTAEISAPDFIHLVSSVLASEALLLFFSGFLNFIL